MHTKVISSHMLWGLTWKHMVPLNLLKAVVNAIISAMKGWHSREVPRDRRWW